MYHRSVLLTESIEALSVTPGGIYVDATFGGGGHTKEILKQLGSGRIFAFDQDEEALENKTDDERVTMIHSNFRYIRNFLRYHKAVPVDGILADLGISSHQIDEADRGFSTRFEASLDMRMDNRRKRKASDIINKSKAEELIRILREYGEMQDAGKIVRAIVNAREEQPIETTARLIELLTPYAERGKENKYFAKLFQALRIEVNQELEALKELLRQGTSILKPGGRFVIIAYHSLEDKLVKNYFRAGNFEGVISKDFYGNELSPLKPVLRKAVVPDEKEIMQNPRARSAKLRAAIKM